MTDQFTHILTRLFQNKMNAPRINHRERYFNIDFVICLSLTEFPLTEVEQTHDDTYCRHDD